MFHRTTLWRVLADRVPEGQGPVDVHPHLFVESVEERERHGESDPFRTVVVASAQLQVAMARAEIEELVQWHASERKIAQK